MDDVVENQQTSCRMRPKHGSGWWFQTFFIFHFIYGMSSFSLTFIFFKMVGIPPTRDPDQGPVSTASTAHPRIGVGGASGVQLGCHQKDWELT